MNLTPKQLRVLQLIAECRAKKGYAPTLQEIGDELGIDKVSAHDRVSALIAKGLVVKTAPGKRRSLDIAPGVVVPGVEKVYTAVEYHNLGFSLCGNPARTYLDIGRAAVAAVRAMEAGAR